MDFRIFLKDYYLFQKKNDKGFTKAYICRALGLPNSRSYFQDVLNGKFLSSPKVSLFIDVLRLTKDEGRYFRVLVNYNQATGDPEEREMIFEHLISLSKTPKKILPPTLYAYYKDWFHASVRAALDVTEFTCDYAKLANLIVPSITIGQAKSSIKLLLKLGLIKKLPNGVHKSTEKAISARPEIQNSLIKDFQVRSLEIAKRTILKYHKSPQRTITKTISISPIGYHHVCKKIDQFIAEITSIVKTDDHHADRIVELDLFLLPRSKWRQN